MKSHTKNPSSQISLYGEEKVGETVRLCRMNLAVHGLEGDIKQGNSYYEDVHESRGRFDFVMANPPFNVNGVDKGKIKDDPRFPYGLPRVDNANYLWIQIFWSSLNPSGRAGFVMANSANDARQSELEVRKQLVEARGVDVMIAIGPNFFYTVTLPCTLWFLDKGKKDTDRDDHRSWLSYGPAGRLGGRVGHVYASLWNLHDQGVDGISIPDAEVLCQFHGGHQLKRSISTSTSIYPRQRPLPVQLDDLGVR